MRDFSSSCERVRCGGFPVSGSRGRSLRVNAALICDLFRVFGVSDHRFSRLVFHRISCFSDERLRFDSLQVLFCFFLLLSLRSHVTSSPPFRSAQRTVCLFPRWWVFSFCLLRKSWRYFCGARICLGGLGNARSRAPPRRLCAFLYIDLSGPNRPARPCDPLLFPAAADITSHTASSRTAFFSLSLFFKFLSDNK